MSVIAVRSMLYKLACQNTDQSNQVSLTSTASVSFALPMIQAEGPGRCVHCFLGILTRHVLGYLQVTVSELAELMEEALDMHSPDDEDIMTYSQFKKMMEFSGI